MYLVVLGNYPTNLYVIPEDGALAALEGGVWISGVLKGKDIGFTGHIGALIVEERLGDGYLGNSIKNL